MRTCMICESELQELKREKGRTHTEKATAGGRVPHPDCEHCKCLKGGTCAVYKKCKSWLAWFRYEWNGIRRAAGKLKKQTDKEKNKMKEEQVERLAKALYTLTSLR